MSLKSHRLALIGAGLVLFTAGFAGCGGDDDSGPLTKDEFIAQADQICADTNASTDANEAEFNSAIQSGDLDAAADLVAESNTEIEDAIGQIEDLDAPEEDQATIDQFLSISNDQIELASKLEGAIRDGDNPELKALGAQADQLQKESDTVADEYGFVDCGSAGNDA